ncbi:beta-ketoacyl synthase N-terminal-like domain-containing protein [Vibrio rhizosphaerae]|uniref:Beta-ketoacyl synthase N-terminal-like domain-containing protein n=1 Tax=Vibrio rhizosphaerae TaxID=398736 RepID=A0ABU4IQK2_9VIBR|nr:beta-ketoacyl synthase N-terminal-like domain-containing protein [Vibrio rhizosphaerae]MDW6091680.1 beta-ketoacyl synthase N-terminal-like domain-containing protein [Vibrio rhizosphaerae]
MRPVYLRRGETLLPNHATLTSLFLENEQLNFELIEYAEFIEQHGFGAYLSDESLKDINAGRMIRKTSEKQSRWLIASAVRTWQRLYGEQQGGSQTGLFLGLGTIDYCEAPEPHQLEQDTLECFSDVMCRESNPLTGLIMLNSSAASHIAQLTGITGCNSCFSPHIDAGAEAIFEAYSHVREGLVTQALFGGGSQKISPWYLLAYENDFADQQTFYLTEASSFAVVTQDRNISEGELLAAFRGRLSKEKSALHALLERALSGSGSEENHAVSQIICTGIGTYKEALLQNVEALGIEIPLIFIEDKLGYCGASSPAIALNLSLELLQANMSLHHDLSYKHGEMNCVLILAFGPSGLVNYFLVGGQHE